MEQERGMIVHFCDGSQIRVNFPRQVTHDDSVPVRLERLLEKNVVMIEADGALLAIPFASIKYVQVYPAPGGLQDYVIRQASIGG
jgi:hypothetical protein